MNERPRWSRRTKILLWSAVAGVGVFVGLLVVSFVLLRPIHFKATLEQKLSDRLGLDVTIESLALSFAPRARISGTNAVFRVPSQPDLPPFLTIDHFWVDIGPLSAIRGHVKTVHVGGLHVAVPPGAAHDAMTPDTAETGASPAPDVDHGGEVIVDHLETENGVLTILRKDPKKPPLEFKIHNLNVDDVGFDRVMRFDAVLTNPLPEGQVTSSGTIGPWKRGDPAALPLAGQYKFTAADLDTIKGIGGTLTSDGAYEGHLTEIRVAGRTDTPDFNLDAGGKPVPLTTEFKAIVDGSDGTTTLEEVNAKLFNTSIKVTGVVENLPGPGRHSITLKVAITDGRIEDVLRLAVDSPKPLLTGDVALTGDVGLPPGRGVVRDRLVVTGRFGLAQARFTDGEVQGKLLELSRRSQGKDKDEEIHAARVMTQLAGTFSLKSGVLTLADTTFVVPGAVVALGGQYGLATSELDFTGTLRMQASLSQAVGGFKSIFVKPFDRLFKRPDAGAVIPIKITGTRDQPKLGVRVGTALSRGEKD